MATTFVLRLSLLVVIGLLLLSRPFVMFVHSVPAVAPFSGRTEAPCAFMCENEEKPECMARCRQYNIDQEPTQRDACLRSCYKWWMELYVRQQTCTANCEGRAKI